LTEKRAKLGLGIALLVLAALLSGTAGRVGTRHAPNTIGMQIAATGVGAAVIPSLTGLVAESLSLDAIPPFLIALMIILIAAYLFSLRKGREMGVAA
jgi:fucose permease